MNLLTNQYYDNKLSLFADRSVEVRKQITATNLAIDVAETLLWNVFRVLSGLFVSFPICIYAANDKSHQATRVVNRFLSMNLARDYFVGFYLHRNDGT